MATAVNQKETDVWQWTWIGLAVYCGYLALRSAYQIRMGAINEFGTVIHEFDPWFVRIKLCVYIINT